MPRDFSVPYTEDELEGLKDVFRKLPTFNDGGYLLSCDIEALTQKMGYERTPEQLAAYKTYYDKTYGGIVPWSIFIKGARVVQDIGKVTVVLAEFFDKNGDGLISTDEFDELMILLVAHEPKLNGISYEAFLKDADTNGDGKVSIEKCSQWIEAQVKNV